MYFCNIVSLDLLSIDYNVLAFLNYNYYLSLRESDIDLVFNSFRALSKGAYYLDPHFCMEAYLKNNLVLSTPIPDNTVLYYAAYHRFYSIPLCEVPDLILVSDIYKWGIDKCLAVNATIKAQAIKLAQDCSSISSFINTIVHSVTEVHFKFDLDRPTWINLNTRYNFGITDYFYGNDSYTNISEIKNYYYGNNSKIEYYRNYFGTYSFYSNKFDIQDITKYHTNIATYFGKNYKLDMSDIIGYCDKNNI